MINFSIFFKINLFISILLFSTFLVFNDSYTFSSFFLVLLGAISSATILYAVLYILLILPSLVSKYGIYLIVSIFAFIHISLILDFLIFRLYDFHINAMVIDILTSLEAIESMELGYGIYYFIAIIIFIVFIEFFILKKINNIDIDDKKKINKRINKIIIIPILIIIFSEKILYGLASLYNRSDILTSFRVIPLYQPFTFNSFAYKYFDFKINKTSTNNIDKKSSLNYPLKKLEYKENLNKVNVFIVAFDALSYSAISKDITPNISKFLNEAYNYTNHYSGGPSTRFGIFSLMYGLNSTYWFNFLNYRRGSILFDVLKELDYEINIVSSTSTSWPEFIKTAYVNIQNRVFDDFDGKPWQKDRQSTKKAIELITKSNKSKPQFTFLFLDAPHGYSYPKEFNKFSAKDEEINYITMNKDKKNSISQSYAMYKNSIFYDDKLFSDFIKTLKKFNLYDDSIIILTSDHGQEFYEYGYFGHNSAFNKSQIKVPFIVKYPNNISKNITSLTSHNDFVPTLLSYIGIKNPTSHYSNGYDLLDDNFKRDYIYSSNWNHNAILTKNNVYIFSNLPNKIFSSEVRNIEDYKKIDTIKNKINSKYLLKVLDENRAFLK